MSKSIIALNLLHSTNSSLSSLKILSTTAQLKQAHALVITSCHHHHHHKTTKTSTKLLHISSFLTPPDTRYTQLLFHQTQSTTFAYNSLLRAQSKSTNPNQTISSYKKLIGNAGKPDGITFSFVIKSCARLKASTSLTGIHGQLLLLGFQRDTLVLNSLIHAYLACGSIDYAISVFGELPERDLVSWTEVIGGLVRTGRAKEAVELFFVMVGEGTRPDEVTVVAALTACARLGDVTLGRKVVSFACEFGVRWNTHVINSLIDMYARCGSIGEARELFDRVLTKDVVSWNSMVSAYTRRGDMEIAKGLFDWIPEKNAVSWSSLIDGYMQNGNYKEAVRVFSEMSGMGITPNEAAMTSTVAACAHLGVLDLGRKIHLSLDEKKVHSDVILSTALVDMYMKCGDLENARALFDKILYKNLVSWNTMLMGLAIHGKALDCLRLFSEMLEVGLKPDSKSFVGVLSACANAGWLREGMEFFIKMTETYGISPRPEHCSCVVHLMGRSGLVVEACEFIVSSSVEPDIATWGALLSSCKAHGYLEIGEFASKAILELDPSHSGAYVQLSNMYASANSWRKVLELRKVMKNRGIRNRVGWSCFELDGAIHEFRVGVTSHPRIKDIHSLLHSIELQMHLHI